MHLWAETGPHMSPPDLSMLRHAGKVDGQAAYLKTMRLTGPNLWSLLWILADAVILSSLSSATRPPSLSLTSSWPFKGRGMASAAIFGPYTSRSRVSCVFVGAAKPARSIEKQPRCGGKMVSSQPWW